MMMIIFIVCFAFGILIFREELKFIYGRKEKGNKIESKFVSTKTEKECNDFLKHKNIYDLLTYDYETREEKNSIIFYNTKAGITFLPTKYYIDFIVKENTIIKIKKDKTGIGLGQVPINLVNEFIEKKLDAKEI